MNYKKEKYQDILNANFDGEYIIIDLRYKIPKSAHDMGLIKMLVENKDFYINGKFDSSNHGYTFSKFRAKIEEDTDGNQSLKFEKRNFE